MPESSSVEVVATIAPLPALSVAGSAPARCPVHFWSGRDAYIEAQDAI